MATTPRTKETTQARKIQGIPQKTLKLERGEEPTIKPQGKLR